MMAVAGSKHQPATIYRSERVELIIPVITVNYEVAGAFENGTKLMPNAL